MDNYDRDKLLKEEERKLKRLRFMVNLCKSALMQSKLSIEESYKIIDDTKGAALMLFPDKEEVFDLIYAPRFYRIIAERFKIAGSQSGRN